MTTKCPGQDKRLWGPKDIFDIKCPKCGELIEFFKDDSTRNCPGCGKKYTNPKIDTSCAKTCPLADKCDAVKQNNKSKN